MERRRSIRMMLLLAGVVGFGVLMAFRSEANGLAFRALIAALAFAWGAFVLHWFLRRA